MRNKLLLLAGVTVAVGIVAAILFTFVLGYDPENGLYLRTARQPSASTEEEKGHAHGRERVQLSPQARKNLRLRVEPIQPTTYWRTIPIPGTVVDRPGRSDRTVTAPIAGVVTEILALPGKTVRPGDQLFKLRLSSESFQTSQMQLYKAVQEISIAQKELDRLTKLAQIGGVSEGRILELQYQKDRQTALAQAHRQDLRVRRLSEAQIKSVEEGKFVTELVIRVPEAPAATGANGQGAAVTAEGSLPASPSSALKAPEYEIQELKANLGDHVEAGRALVSLADHRLLYLKGQGLKQETPLLAQAAKEGWLVEPEFTEEIQVLWPEVARTRLRIEFLAPTTDASGLTIPFYVPFVNPVREYDKDGKTYRTWLFRPGQRVLLKVAVEKLDGVLVVPRDAMVREGPEAYVFVENGPAFDRRQVHVLHEGTSEVVLGSDSDIVPGHFVALNGAAALNRVLKAKAAGSEGGGHPHPHPH